MDPKLMASLVSRNLGLSTKILTAPGGKFKNLKHFGHLQAPY